MKSNFKSMVLSLGLLCLIAGGTLAVVNYFTEEPIAEAALKAQRDAIAELLPPFEGEIMEQEIGGLTVFTPESGTSEIGCVVRTSSDEGFGGPITLLVGFDPEGTLRGYRVLSHTETPGLGAKMDTWFSDESHSVVGTANTLKVKSDGGDVDAITGATITSRAFLSAINKARAVFAVKDMK